MADEVESTNRSNTYPAVFPGTVSHSEFPADAAIADAIGMPLGCFVNPFVPCADRSQITLEASKYVDDATKLARCDTCAAYINPHCDATQVQWYCSICGNRNSITRSMTRYRHSDVRTLPETREPMVEFPMPFREIDGADPSLVGQRSVTALEHPLVHVFVIQESMDIDALQAVVEGLSAAIMLMHPDIHIVILTFSHRIGIHKLVMTGMDDGEEETTEDSGAHVEYVSFANDGGRGAVLDASLSSSSSQGQGHTPLRGSNSSINGTPNRTPNRTGRTTTVPIPVARHTLGVLSQCLNDWLSYYLLLVISLTTYHLFH